MRPRGPIPVKPAPGDDAPVFEGGLIFDESLELEVEFAPRALRPPSRRGPLVAGAWALAVVSLVAVGVFSGGPPEADSAADRPGDGAPPLGDARPAGPDLPSGRTAELPLAQAIDIESPVHRGVIGTRQVHVRGTVLVRADHVEIALEARGNRALDRVSVDVFDPDGGIRPARTPTFEAAFDLPLPRPNGTMWIVVTAYDDRGMPVGSARHRFEVGALVRVAAVPGYDKGLDGNWPWGPYYEPPPRVALAAPLPTCLPISTTLASQC